MKLCCLWNYSLTFATGDNVWLSFCLCLVAKIMLAASRQDFIMIILITSQG